jgi:hypothetical protein
MSTLKGSPMIEKPLTAFVEADPVFDPASLTTVRFIFDQTSAGVVVLDDVGFRNWQCSSVVRVLALFILGVALVVPQTAEDHRQHQYARLCAGCRSTYNLSRIERSP